MGIQIVSPLVKLPVCQLITESYLALNLRMCVPIPSLPYIYFHDVVLNYGGHISDIYVVFCCEYWMTDTVQIGCHPECMSSSEVQAPIKAQCMISPESP